MILRSTFLVAAGGILIWSGVQAAAPVTQGNEDATARLDRIEKLLSNHGLLDMLNQLQTLQDQVSQLRGQIEVQDHELQQLRERQHSLYTDIDQRLQRLEGGHSPAAGGPGAAKPGNVGPPLQDLSAVTAPDTGSTGGAGSSLTVSTVGSATAGQAPASKPQASAATAPEATPAPAAANVSKTPGGNAPATAANGSGAHSPASSASPSTQSAAGGSAQPAAAPSTVAAANQPAGNAQTPMPEDSAQVQAQYQQAFQLLKQSQYNQAIKAFQQFLAAHPQGQYSDNAQYWLAESYYVTGDFQKAIGEYQKLVTNFPDSPKLTHGLLKIAFCYQALGKTEQARQQLENLVQKYPGTTAAQLADERLKQLSSTPPAATPTS